MFISEFALENFGKIQNLYVETQGKNIFLVGENGSGKTTVLQALSMLLCNKTAKRVNKSDFVGPYGDDFKISCTLSNGYKINKTLKTSVLELPSGDKIKKAAEIDETIGVSPDLFFNLAYIKQLEIAGFFEGNKSMLHKITNLIYDVDRLKKLNEGLATKGTYYKTYISSNDFDDVEELQVRLKESKANLKEVSEQIKSLESIDFKHVNDQYILHKELEKIINTLSHIRNQYMALPDLEKLKGMMKYTREELQQQRDEFFKYESLKKTMDGYVQDKEIITSIIDNDLETILSFLKINKKVLKESGHPNATKFLKYWDIVLNMMTSEYHIPDKNKAENILQFISENMDAKNSKDQDYIISQKNLYKSFLQYTGRSELHKSIVGFIIQVSKDFENFTIEIMKSLIESEFINPLDKKISEFQMNIQETVAFLKKHEFTKSTVYDLRLSHIHEYESTKMQKDKLNIEIKELNEKEKRIRSEISMNMEEIDSYKTKYNLLKNLKDQLALIESGIKMINTEYEKALAVKDMKLKYNILLKDRKIINDFPKYLRNVVFNQVSDILNNQFSELFSFESLGKLRIDWDNAEIYIGNQNFEQQSGAQQITISLVLRLALLSILKTYIPIMLIDEPTVSLDENRIADLKMFLTVLGKNIQLFVSTHNYDIVDPENSLIINMQ